ncbi:MAG: glucosamine-6-phosphate deaminase, partial [Candidatus Omnitrophica bacterium]|nr:glucosamine-6-phosphate deaminase [Candidatus Omnitrophota bacterium]
MTPLQCLSPSRTFTADSLPVRVFATAADLARDAAPEAGRYLR